ncbi:hypothetical protein [Desulfosporosinus nitroreducens]|nr:hypothetical protein [Desulfosporosinus nitroreducens]MCO1602746.1 hypothetical protein [Desulfosporosinus nitroreducens]
MEKTTTCDLITGGCFLVPAFQLVLGMYSQGEVAETSPVIRNICKD